MIPATPAMITALESETAEPASLYEMEFRSGTKRYTDYATSSLTGLGYTWERGSGIIDISGLTDWGAGSGFPRITMTMSAVNTTRLNDIVTDSSGQILRWYLAMVERGSRAATADPILRAAFKMFPVSIDQSPDRLTVDLGLESVAERSEVRAPRTRSHPDQTQDAPNDDCYIDAGVTHKIRRTNFRYKSGF